MKEIILLISQQLQVIIQIMFYVDNLLNLLK